MQKPIRTAKDELIQLISTLEQKRKYINSSELILILEKTKVIYRNDGVIDAIINSIRPLLNTKLYNRNKLTNREQQVMLLIGQGLRNTDIAEELSLSISTIETHRKNIRKKLKINGKDNLIVFALIYKLQHQNEF